ncbi:MAG: hypothetical protein WBI40_07415 [Methylococcaceae bacterium]
MFRIPYRPLFVQTSCVERVGNDLLLVSGGFAYSQVRLVLD